MDFLFCTVCEVLLDDEDSCQEHALSTKHRLKYLQNFYTVNRSILIANKNGIEICADVRGENENKNVIEGDGRISLYLKPGHSDSLHVFIKNTNSQGSVMLHNVMPLYPCSNINISDEHEVTQELRTIKLNHGATYRILFNAEAGEESTGVQEMPVVFVFTLDEANQPFYILKILCAQFLDEIGESALPSSMFEKIDIRGTFLRPPKVGTYIKGQPSSGYEINSHYVYSNYYPDWLRDLVIVKFDPKRVSPENMNKYRRVRKLMNAGLKPDNYTEWFQTQLWIEEIERELNLKYFHKTGVPVSLLDDPEYVDSIQLITLEVPGLLEKRPCVLVGDSIFLRHAGQETPIYEGRVHRIVDETVHLGFDSSFLQGFHDGLSVDVQFWFNRTTFIRCHNGLQYASFVRNILFPTIPKTSISKQKNDPLVFVDACLAKNAEQRQAVTAIVYEHSAPAPYVLFGPPGTGKTLTVVEAIKQVYKKDDMNRILVCGPSNSACDIITERLITDVPAKHIIRVNAKSRLVKNLPRAVRSVSAIEEDCVMFPSMEQLATYRVVVTTLMTALKVIPKLIEGCLESTYTHIFLDECGHGQEPEALLPLLGGARMVVLAGDPCQLGPVVQSKICHTAGRFFKSNGLDQSLLERLMKLPLYSPDESGSFNPRFVTKLLDNYRSHGDILHVSNTLFYRSELRACGPKGLINSMLSWKNLPNKKVPLIFHGVNGKDDREENNPSYFNPHEVSQVVKYVRELRKKMQVKPDDIGIVAPYRAQILKIRAALSKEFGRWASNLRVGSSEEFQGDERLVVIVSTVRASAELLRNDIILQLGFLCNPKRFNVAVTRAQALMVVVGCPWLLQRDPHWGELLKFCYEKGCYIGCKYEALETDEVEGVYNAFEKLDINVQHSEE